MCIYRKEKDPLKPKHPLSAFFLFSNERRAALLAENKNVKEVAKIAGEEWRNMTDEQKAPYEEGAMKNKEQYAKEMEIYRKNKEEEAANSKKEDDEMDKIRKHEAMQLLKKKEKAENLIKKTKEEQKKKQKEEKNTDPNKPKKPATSYLLFSKEERKKIAEEKPGTNNSTVTALISVKWKEMSEEDKQVWNNMAAEAMGAYKKELEEYNKAKEQNNNNN
nr:high mobility group B protein 6-like isoform X1 [Ipomoea batatas]